MRFKKTTVAYGDGYKYWLLRRWENPAYAGLSLPPLYTQNDADVMVKEGNVFWVLSRGPGPSELAGMGWSGTTFTAIVDNTFNTILGFEPFPWRAHALDRAPWLAANVVQARANMTIGALVLETNTIVYGFSETPDPPGFIQYVDPLGYWYKTETLVTTTGGALKAALARMVWYTYPDGYGEWVFSPVCLSGTLSAANENKTLKFSITNYVKQLLGDRAGAFAGFADFIVPNTVDITNYQGAADAVVGAMINLYQATVTGAFTFSEAGSPPQYYQVGTVEVRRLHWTGGGFAEGYVDWDPAGWGLGATSRVPNGLAPRQTPLA